MATADWITYGDFTPIQGYVPNYDNGPPQLPAGLAGVLQGRSMGDAYGTEWGYLPEIRTPVNLPDITNVSQLPLGPNNGMSGPGVFQSPGSPHIDWTGVDPATYARFAAMAAPELGTGWRQAAYYDPTSQSWLRHYGAPEMGDTFLDRIAPMLAVGGVAALTGMGLMGLGGAGGAGAGAMAGAPTAAAAADAAWLAGTGAFGAESFGAGALGAGGLGAAGAADLAWLEGVVPFGAETYGLGGIGNLATGATSLAELAGPPEFLAPGFFGPPEELAAGFFGPPEALSPGFFGPPEELAPGFFGPPSPSYFEPTGAPVVDRSTAFQGFRDIPLSDTVSNLATIAQGVLSPGGLQSAFGFGNLGGLGSTGGLLNIGSSLYGLYQSEQQKKLAKKMLERADPFGSQRGAYAARLAALEADPWSITNQPGYKFGLDQGLQAVQRRMAASGYNGSGNEAIALQKYAQDYGLGQLNTERQRLAELAGAGINPVGGAQLGLYGNSSAIDMAMNSLASLGYSLSPEASENRRMQQSLLRLLGY